VKPRRALRRAARLRLPGPAWSMRAPGSPASGTSATAGALAPASGSSTSGSSTSGSSAKGSSAKGSSSAKPAPASRQAGTTRSATGPQVNHDYGILSVRVTVSGKKIVNVGIASLDDGGNPRSQMIDQQSIPILEQETLQTQSASIQSVSGASYTSAGFVQSLQSALHSLGVQ
jgi:uncharacterized protein with FMN-binding domain